MLRRSLVVLAIALAAGPFGCGDAPVPGASSPRSATPGASEVTGGAGGGGGIDQGTGGMLAAGGAPGDGAAGAGGLGGAGGAAVALAPDFSLLDVNPASPTANQPVSPRDYLMRVSAWYFGHAT